MTIETTEKSRHGQTTKSALPEFLNSGESPNLVQSGLKIGLLGVLSGEPKKGEGRNPQTQWNLVHKTASIISL